MPVRCLDNSNARRYYFTMIASFANADTEAVFKGERSRKLPPTIHRVAMRKLWIIDAAVSLSDLRVPPGNRLEKLTGKYREYHSIRINDQWRICFRFESGNAHNVIITDYH